MMERARQRADMLECCYGRDEKFGGRGRNVKCGEPPECHTGSSLTLVTPTNSNPKPKPKR